MERYPSTVPFSLDGGQIIGRSHISIRCGCDCVSHSMMGSFAVNVRQTFRCLGFLAPKPPPRSSTALHSAWSKDTLRTSTCGKQFESLTSRKFAFHTLLQDSHIIVNGFSFEICGLSQHTQFGARTRTLDAQREA